MITKDAILARQSELQSGALQLRDQIWHLKQELKAREGDLFATNGAIEDCQHWLEFLGLNEQISKACEDASKKTIFSDDPEVMKETSRDTLNDFARMAMGEDMEDHYADSNGIGY